MAFDFDDMEAGKHFDGVQPQFPRRTPLKKLPLDLGGGTGASCGRQ